MQPATMAAPCGHLSEVATLLSGLAAAPSSSQLQRKASLRGAALTRESSIKSIPNSELARKKSRHYDNQQQRQQQQQPASNTFNLPTHKNKIEAPRKNLPASGTRSSGKLFQLLRTTNFTRESRTCPAAKAALAAPRSVQVSLAGSGHSITLYCGGRLFFRGLSQPVSQVS